jgi:hypothetical protein
MTSPKKTDLTCKQAIAKWGEKIYVAARIHATVSQAIFEATYGSTLGRKKR